MFSYFRDYYSYGQKENKCSIFYKLPKKNFYINMIDLNDQNIFYMEEVISREYKKIKLGFVKIKT